MEHPLTKSEAEQLIAHAGRLKTLVHKHKNALATHTMATVKTLEAAAGGAAMGFADGYWGEPDPDTGIPELTVGPAPVNLLAGFAGSIAGYVAAEEEWGKHAHGFADGIVGYASGVNALRLAVAMKKKAA